MVKVFVDIGSHIGESIVEILKPKYDFDRVICIEPSSYAFAKLSAYRDTRLELHNWGAWDANVVGTLFSAGAVGGSLFDDKPQHWNREESVELRDIKEFFDENFSFENQIFLKLNVEGAEYSILNRLFEREQLNWKIEHLLLSLDMPKVPRLRDKVDNVTKTLQRSGVRYEYRKASDPSESIAIWLKDKTVIYKCSPQKWVSYFFKLPLYTQARFVFRRVIPKKLWLLLAIKFGPNRLKKF